MNSLSPPIRRFAAICLLIFLAAIVWSLMVFPLITTTTGKLDNLNEQRFQLTKLEQRTALNKRILTPEAVDQLEHNTVKGIFFAASESDAASNAQSSVDGILRESDLQMENMRVSTAMEGGGTVRLILDVRAKGLEENVLRALSTLESHAPKLFVEHLALISQGLPEQPRSAGPEILMDVRIVAFWSKEFGG